MEEEELKEYENTPQEEVYWTSLNTKKRMEARAPQDKKPSNGTVPFKVLQLQFQMKYYPKDNNESN